MRTIAVDWSGDATDARDKIWLAEVDDDRLVRLESGRSRDGVVDYLVALAERGPNLVVGLDFAFSLPAWFLEERDLASAEELWKLVRERGEHWLDECEPPFWGRAGAKKPELPAHYRKTELHVRELTEYRPKSPFQISGRGTVGTSSLRGMPHLLRLVHEGYSIWPFDEPDLPLAVEIYPRLLTGSVVKSDLGERRSYLIREYPDLGDGLRERAASSDDAFDAAVSALAMYDHVGEFLGMERAVDPVMKIEGAIWWPSNPQLINRPDL